MKIVDATTGDERSVAINVDNHGLAVDIPGVDTIVIDLSDNVVVVATFDDDGNESNRITLEA